MERLIGGRSLESWIREYPVLKKIMNAEEVLWVNTHAEHRHENAALSVSDVAEAEQRLSRFAPFIRKVFPETKRTNGLIESPLYQIPNMKRYDQQNLDLKLSGSLMLKADNELPISGSIKARGGIYEVLATAERLAMQSGLLQPDDDYARLASPPFRRFFSSYSVAVGSTGNLGLSVGITAARLGFRTVVHMSKDAREWKKAMLRINGAEVREYDADYSLAVSEGRKMAERDSRCHFIDDENSKDLFVGYATAGNRLKKQFETAEISVDEAHPLFVYLPCGVGGGPCGVTFGLKQAFGSNVHAFLVEPTHAPCFLLGMLTGRHDQVSVHDFRLDGRTAADGLAVPRASAFAGRAAGHLVAGCMTIDDDRLFHLLKALFDEEKIRVEPSAAAGAIGPAMLLKTVEGQRYLETHRLIDHMAAATHLIWSTGGSMVPENIWQSYYHQHQ